MKKLKYHLLSFAIALTLLILFMHVVGWQELHKVYRNTNPYVITFTVTLSFIGFAFGAKVWKTILDFLSIRMKFFKVLKLFYIGLFTNYITPLGQAGGEPFIAYVLSKKSKTPYEKSLAIILSADVLGAIAPIIFASIGLSYFILFREVSPAMFRTIILIIVLAILIVLGILTLQTKRCWIEKIVLKFARNIGQVLKLFKRDSKKIERYFGHANTRRRINLFYETFHSVLVKKKWSLLLFTQLNILTQILVLYYSVVALGAKPPFLLILAVLPMASLASYLPLPGGLGGVEIAITALLVSICGLSLGVASGAALVYRFITYWIPLGIGGIISLFTLKKASQTD